MMSDSELLQQFFNGDDTAFTAIVQRYEPLLLNFAWRFFQERGRAEDVCQVVWVQLFLSRPLQSGERSLKPWLTTVLHHRCIDEIRREKRSATILFSRLNEEEDGFVVSLPDGDALPDEACEVQEERQQLAWAISQLPCKYRTVIWLQTYRQLSYTEIAQILSCDPETVRTWLYRARSLLRRILVQRV